MDKPNKNHSAAPNQHHAIQYSSQFTPDASKKPVPLAHFMGARRDLNGPILTKQRVDEKEIRPDGWELAEKRSQMAQSSSNGISSLASFLAGGKQMSSHAANLSKRALPGMTSSNPPDTKSSAINKTHIPQSDPPKTNDPSKHPPPISHAASYLKPKSLADRLAQLGVSHDAQSAKLNPPPLQHTSNKEHNLEPAETDLSRNVHRITKSTSATSLLTPTVVEESKPAQHQRPLSVQILPTRGALPTIPSPQSNNLPQISPSYKLAPTDSSIGLPVENITSQTPTSHKKNQRPLSTFVAPPTPESSSNLSIPSKSMTASLSRLAGSNIVAQRLQWSKEKEQVGTMDEFGSPLVKTSPNLSAQIPSPVLPESNSNPLPNTMASTTRNLDTNQTNRVFLERNKNSNLESGSENNPTSNFKSSPRFNFSQKVETHTHSLKSVDDPIKRKNLNQFNKSVRRSDEDEEEQAGSNLVNKDTLHRDNKRNKKNENQNLQSSNDLLSSKKKDHFKVDRSIIINKAKEDIIPSNPNSPSTSPRFPSSHKLRSTRGSHRQSSSVGSPHSSSFINNNKHRAEVTHKVTSPTSHGSTRQLPSIPSFSPMMKKGTSELAAVWGTQLSNINKKNNPTEPQTPISPTTTHQNSRPPLPIPPISTKASGGGAMDGRPLPIPPPASPLNLDLGPELRPRSRPLPVPQAKSPEPSFSTHSAERSKTGSFKPHANNIDGSLVWRKYQDRHENFLPEFNRPNQQVEVEIFQLNRTESNEFSTTSLDPEEYQFFYTQERLLIILKLKLEKKMILMIWKGSDVSEDEKDGEDEDLETRAKIERLLKKYGIDQQSKLVLIRHGYEPPELVQALGGKLFLRKGDRFDSVYQRDLSSIFICKSFQVANGSKVKPVVIVEESILDPGQTSSTHLEHSSVFCSGYSGILKFYHRSRATFSLFIWKGKFSSSIEADECRSLARQIRNEVAPLKIDVEEVLEGKEPQKLIEIIGKNAHFAQSYHWRYKPLVPMMTMITNAGGEIKERISPVDISIVYTGLEVYVIVPHRVQRGESWKQEPMKSSLQLARAISENTVTGDHHPFHRRLASHALLFPSIIPLDLLASVRFSNDLLRLNDGLGVVDKMNLVELNEFN